ncbi:MAG: IS200/IS605 family element transposase accessory protein TnpB [Candidatus Omnitrophica bacterium]|nr:IS200/IS605 family element transposase accessory protein TnpB [Candidatus Omnitrophota bacterium]
MLVHQSYRYELKPNNKQMTLLAKHAGCARFAYNWGLSLRIEEYKLTKKSSNAIAQHKQLNLLKKTQFPWMYEVSKCAPQEALRDLDKAFNNFYRGLKSKRKVGHPKFRKKNKNDSFRLTGSMHVHTDSVILPRIGIIRTKELTDLKGDILSATVSKDIDRWFVSFSVERQRKECNVIKNQTIGIDVGLNSFCSLSDGTKIESPKPLEHALKLLKKRQRQHSKKKKGSQNRKRSTLSLGRLHRRIRNERKDFLNKLSTHLAKTKSVIIVEDLNIKGMLKNHNLSRQIADSGWSQFLNQLSYKSTWYGSELIKAPRFYPSSKTCSVCGAVRVDMDLSERKFICGMCGTIIDRDQNAARNLAYLSPYQNIWSEGSFQINNPTPSFGGSYACGDTSGGGTQSNLRSTSHVSVKQEADTRYSDGISG